MNDILKNINHLDIPFKEFMPGQIIQSEQFNDDMRDIEDKVNEIVDANNLCSNSFNKHITNQTNPHGVTAQQVGAYTVEEVDGYVEDLKNGNLNDNVITNRLMSDNSVDTSNLVDYSVTLAKLDRNIGSQIDLSGNTTITSSYSKEEVDKKFEEYQAGTIVDGTIGVEKLKKDVGENLDINNNPAILERYTRTEVDLLIAQKGIPKDWGSITDVYEDVLYGNLPVADIMVADTFTIEETDVLDLKIKEVVDARGSHATLGERVDSINSLKIDDLVLEGNNLLIKANGSTLKTITLPSIGGQDLDEILNGVIGGEY